MEQSLYDRIGGAPAVNAAVDRFYDLVLADARISHMFDGVDTQRLRAKQKLFLTYAFGGAPNYPGLSLRRAHERLVKEHGLTDAHFDAVAENLLTTLKELAVAPELVAEVLSIVSAARNDVLNR